MDDLTSVMTQPWSPWEPRLNDYAGYAITSGTSIVTLKKFVEIRIFVIDILSSSVDNFCCQLNKFNFSGLYLPNRSGPTFRPRQFSIGAPRAGSDRSGAVFVVEYEGKSEIRQVKKLTGENYTQAL